MKRTWFMIFSSHRVCLFQISISRGREAATCRWSDLSGRRSEGCATFTYLVRCYERLIASLVPAVSTTDISKLLTPHLWLYRET